MFLKKPTNENEQLTPRANLSENQKQRQKFSLVSALFFTITSIVCIILPFIIISPEWYIINIKIWCTVLNVILFFGSVVGFFGSCCCSSSSRSWAVVYIHILNTVVPFLPYLAVNCLLFGICEIRYNFTGCYGNIDMDYGSYEAYIYPYNYSNYSSQPGKALALLIFEAVLLVTNFVVGKLFISYFEKDPFIGKKLYHQAVGSSIFFLLSLCIVWHVFSWTLTGNSMYGNTGSQGSPAQSIFPFVYGLFGLFLLIMLFFITLFFCCHFLRKRFYIVHNIVMVTLILLVLVAAVAFVFVLVHHVSAVVLLNKREEVKDSDVYYRNDVFIPPFGCMYIPGTPMLRVPKQAMLKSATLLLVVNVLLQLCFIAWVAFFAYQLWKTMASVYAAVTDLDDGVHHGDGGGAGVTGDAEGGAYPKRAIFQAPPPPPGGNRDSGYQGLPQNGQEMYRGGGPSSPSSSSASYADQPLVAACPPPPPQPPPDYAYHGYPQPPHDDAYPPSPPLPLSPGQEQGQGQGQGQGQRQGQRQRGRGAGESRNQGRSPGTSISKSRGDNSRSASASRNAADPKD